MSIKEYIYTTGDKIQLWSANLSAKMEAVRQNQDEILKFKKTFEDLVKESNDVVESIQKTADNIGDYDTAQIRDISDIGGIKKLVSDLKETRSVANKSIADLKAHIKNVKEAGKSLEDTAKDIDESEKAIAELMQAEADAAKVQAKAEDHLNEDLLEEKDQAANRATKSDPESTTADCPLKDCTIDYFTVEDNSGRMIAFDNNVEPDAPSDKNKSSSEDQKSAEDNKKSPPPPTTLYVICGEKDGYSEEITIESHGDCKNGAACPAVSLKGGSIDESKTVKLNKIRLKSEKIIPEKSWGDFLRKVIIPDMKVLSKPVEYNVNVHDCDSKDDISELKIISFPPAGWSGEASFEYTEKSKDEKKEIRERNRETEFETTESMGEWKIGGKMGCYLDKEEWEYTPPETFLKAVQACMNRITPLFNEIDNDYAKVKIGWPNIKLSGNVDLAEVPEHNKLSYKGEINLTANPFLGVDVDVDIKKIIQRILKTSSPFGLFLTEVMEIAEQGVGNRFVGGEAAINVMLEAKSAIEGDLQWQRKPNEGKWNTDNSKSCIGGFMSITIYGDVKVKGHAFKVKASAGASIHLKSYDGKEASKFDLRWAALEGMENPSLERQMSFNGLAIYYSAYAQLGTDETATGKATEKLIKALMKQDEKLSRSRDGDSEADNNDIDNSESLIRKGSKELKELCRLMKPWKNTNESTEIGKDDV